jgi:pilus assembly protein CpaF
VTSMDRWLASVDPDSPLAPASVIPLPAPPLPPSSGTETVAERPFVSQIPAPPEPEPARSASGIDAAVLGERPVAAADPLAALRRRVEEALFRSLGARLHDPNLEEEELRALVGRELSTALAAEQTALSETEREQVVGLLAADVLGHGPLEQFLTDDAVTEVMVNGLDPIWVEREGRLEETDARFASEAHLRQVIDRIVSRVGRRVDESSPMVDARLPDGSRVNAVIPPLSVDGPALTIRRFAKHGFSVDDLVRSGSLTQQAADLLEACVRGRLNVLVSGGTGSGKTTMLNVLSSFIPDDQRIVTIEDAVELRLHQRHVIRLEARPPNIEGRGHVSIRDLVRNALRMRPDRIIVGEVRSGEALDMLQAMNTGHDGSLSTLHANQPRDALARLETMVLMAGFDLPVRAIREQMAAAVDLIVHVARLRDGSRRITHIVELEGMEGDVITLTDLFTYDHAEGRLRTTGLRPKFAEHLADLGVVVPLVPQGFERTVALGALGR